MYKDSLTHLIDPTCVADTFTEGIGHLEKIGESCVRITMFANRAIGEGEMERIVVARLVMPVPNFRIGLTQCAAFDAGIPQLSDNVPPDATTH